MENNIINQENQETLTVNKMTKKNLTLYLILVAVMIGLGVFTGSLIPKTSSGGNSAKTEKGTIAKQDIAKGKEFGVEDPGKADTATGVVEKGGVDGEGTHKLLREGGPSQTVYMTSSVLDLDSFAGVKLQVWGETMKAQKAGWLMDVVKVKVLE